jgi:hypothetical protein
MLAQQKKPCTGFPVTGLVSRTTTCLDYLLVVQLLAGLTFQDDDGNIPPRIPISGHGHSARPR